MNYKGMAKITLINQNHPYSTKQKKSHFRNSKTALYVYIKLILKWSLPDRQSHLQWHWLRQ
ncbi:hypothetical protein BACINT_02471 [Bacteroides intestinalis DSM 17393]|uniref:Uncharacterized protein n=1 Tax=Bacteroides intestinalis DSM 17393 TaxID=471870 RepID=B3CEF2_9BACE|nr:hypothetical protein BACINT_02471 [Bacteroides intestinalis DSM 17393]